MTFSSLQDVVQANVPILCPDTCILLDFICSPIRENITQNTTLATTFIHYGIVIEKVFGCIISEQVVSEIKDNIKANISETQKSIDKLQITLSRMDEWAKPLGFTNKTSLVHLDSCIMKSKTLMDEILEASIIQEINQGIKERAYNRGMAKRTPASKGNSSLPDCVITESYIELAQYLRHLGHTSPIIFASSNINDFTSDKKNLKSDLQEEFDQLGIKYAHCLPRASALLKQSLPTNLPATC